MCGRGLPGRSEPPASSLRSNRSTSKRQGLGGSFRRLAVTLAGWFGVQRPACQVGCGSALASPAFSGPRSRASGFWASTSPRQHRPGCPPASVPRMGPAPAGGRYRTTTSTRCMPQRTPRHAQNVERRPPARRQEEPLNPKRLHARRWQITPSPAACKCAGCRCRRPRASSGPACAGAAVRWRSCRPCAPGRQSTPPRACPGTRPPRCRG